MPADGIKLDRVAIFLSAYARRPIFHMAQPADSYRNDHSKMVVQLERPAKVRYRIRAKDFTK